MRAAKHRPLRRSQQQFPQPLLVEWWEHRRFC
jgi:hypothetical protein